MLTIKSDDIKGRIKTYEAIVRSKKIPEPGIPESFNVLTKEIMGLGFDMSMVYENQKFDILNDDDQEIETVKPRMEEQSLINHSPLFSEHERGNFNE